MTKKKLLALCAVALIALGGVAFAVSQQRNVIPEVILPSAPSGNENSEVTPPATEVSWKKEIPDVMGKPKAEAEKLLKNFKANQPEFIYKLEVVETEATSKIDVVFFADYVDNVTTKETYYSVLVSKKTEQQQEVSTEETTEPLVVSEGDKVTSKPTEPTSKPKTDA